MTALFIILYSVFNHSACISFVQKKNSKKVPRKYLGEQKKNTIGIRTPETIIKIPTKTDDIFTKGIFFKSFLHWNRLNLCFDLLLLFDILISLRFVIYWFCLKVSCNTCLQVSYLERELIKNHQTTRCYNNFSLIVKQMIIFVLCVRDQSIASGSIQVRV